MANRDLQPVLTAVSTDQSFVAVGLQPNTIFLELETGMFKLIKVEQTNILPTKVVEDERVMVGTNAYLWYFRATEDVPFSKIYFKEVNWTRIGLPDNTCSYL